MVEWGHNNPGRHEAGRFGQAQDGAIAVEFGFIAPVLLVLVLGGVEASQAFSDQLTVQSAARAGTHYGLTVPPVGNNMQPIIDAVKANMPASWIDAANAQMATVDASIVCECQVSGPVACGTACGAGERSISYLKVRVAKPYKPILSFRNFSPNLTLSNTSTIRLQ